MCWTPRKIFEKFFRLSLEENGSPRRGKFNFVESTWKSREWASRPCWLRFWQNFLFPWSEKGELLFQKGENRLSQIKLKITWVSKSTMLITILAKFFISVEWKRRTALPKGRKSTFPDQAKNHVSEQVDHADYDSGKIFLPRGVKKEELLFQKGEKRLSQIKLKITWVSKSTILVTILAKFFFPVE